METRICMYAAGWMSLLVFVVVPILTVVLGYDKVIFDGGEISGNLLLLNALSAMPFFVAAKFCTDSTVPYQLNRSDPTEYPIGGLSLLVICWTVAFLVFGGLTFREEDVSLGIAARNPIFNLIQRFDGAIQISCTYLFLVMPRLTTSLRILGLVSITSYCGGFILSGSRGPVFGLILACWSAKQLSAPPSVRTTADALSVAVAQVVKSIRYLLLGLLGATILGIWGSYRDHEEDVLFATLYRAAEPYWYQALVYHEGQDVDWNVLGDALSRIASIPQRWFGVEFNGTVDGHDVILENYLGITYQEGVSLPITLVGEGHLFAGHMGAILFDSAAVGMIFLSLKIVRSLRYHNNLLLVAFLGSVCSRCFYLYPSSLSGAFLVLFYEVPRDYVLITVLFACLSGFRYVASQIVR